MTPLRARVPLAPGEAVVGYASRLATCNDVSLSEFCGDVEVVLRDIVRGDPVALERVAELGGEEVVALEDGIIGYVSHTFHTVRGEVLKKRGLRRRSLTICPRCIAEDVARGGLPARELAYDRLLWHVAGIETCLVHGVALLHLEGDLAYNVAYDFSTRLAPYLDRLPRLVDEAPERPITPFETYLSDRLNKGSWNPCPLDAMPFHAAWAACLRIGMLATSGPRGTAKSLSSDERRQAEAVGFDALRRGRSGLWHLLDDRLSGIIAGRESQEGPQALFGNPWKWLHSVRDDEAYAPLLQDVFAFVFDRFPLAAGTQILGQTLERRRWHSVRSAALEAGLTPARARRMLVQKGLLPDREAGRCDSLALVDAELATAALATTGRLLESSEVLSRLNVKRKILDNLVLEGLLCPGTRTSSDRAKRWQFEPADLEHFERGLFQRAVPVREREDQDLDVGTCAVTSGFALSRVVRLAVDDQSLWRGRAETTQGLPALLLRVDDVLDRLSNPKDARGAGDLSRILKVARTTASALIADGTITSRMSESASPGGSVRVVDQADVDAFASEYATIRTLSYEIGLSANAIRHWLAINDVEPALPVQTRASAIYRRSALPSKLPEEGGSPLLTAHEVARGLGIGTADAASLLSAGLLPFRTVPGPVSGKPMRVVAETDLEAFKSEFVTLRQLAQERDMSPTETRRSLLANDTRPVSTREGRPGIVYRRRDISRLRSDATQTSI